MAGIPVSTDIDLLLRSANAASARTNLGLGSISTQSSSSISVTGGTVSGLTQFGVSMPNNTAMTGFSLGSITDTTSRPFTISQTFNNAALSGVAVRVDVTDTASASDSEFFQIRRDGSRFLSVSKWTAFSISNMPKIEGNGTAAGWVSFNSPHGTVALGRKDGGWNWVAGHNEAFGPSNMRLGWAANNQSGSLVSGGETGWTRIAADVIGQHRLTNAQTYQVYGTRTDASNYTRLSLAATATAMTIAAETAGTGADNIDLSIIPAGTGKVCFGSHSTISSEILSGFIVIKDSSGTERKLAVVA
jgi:hypothetical protein